MPSEEPQLKRTPLYQQVHDLLMGQIIGGAWPPGSNLPNEYALSQQFNVSIGTIRAAINLLVEKKIVARQQGRGTIVLDGLSNGVRKRMTRIRLKPDGRFVAHEFKSLRTEQIDAPPTVQEVLKLIEGTRVDHVERMRWFDKTNVTFEHLYFPTSLFPYRPEKSDLREGAVALSRMNGIVIERMQEKVKPALPDERIARLLKIEVSQPILRMERIIYSTDNLALELRIGYAHLPDAYYFFGED